MLRCIGFAVLLCLTSVTNTWGQSGTRNSFPPAGSGTRNSVPSPTFSSPPPQTFSPAPQGSGTRNAVPAPSAAPQGSGTRNAIPGSVPRFSNPSAGYYNPSPACTPVPVAPSCSPYYNAARYQPSYYQPSYYYAPRYGYYSRPYYSPYRSYYSRRWYY